MTQGRRLAAVLAADVAGFSALMGADEDGTFAALQALRRATDAIITGHGGRIANTAGDSIVARPRYAEESGGRHVRCDIGRACGGSDAASETQHRIGI